MSTATETDTDVLAGLEERRGCEHTYHGQDAQWHEDGNEQFVLVTFPCGCDPEPMVLVFCRRWLEWPGLLYCPDCGATEYSSEAYAVLGPANN